LEIPYIHKICILKIAVKINLPATSFCRREACQAFSTKPFQKSRLQKNTDRADLLKSMQGKDRAAATLPPPCGHASVARKLFEIRILGFWSGPNSNVLKILAKKGEGTPRN
jgi:hypothetical protein